MGKLLKIIGMAICSIAALIILAIVLLVIFVDPNQYKAKISQLVYDNTGRELIINGDISWKFFPHFGISVNDVSFSNPSSFKEKNFVSLKQADVAVEVLPLLDNQVKIETLSLDQATVYLIKDKNGRANWEGFNKPIQQKNTTKTIKNTTTQPKTNNSSGNKAPSSQEPQAHEKSSNFSFDVQAFTIKNATVFWQDQQTGEKAQLSDLNISSSAIALNKAFPVDFSVAAKLQQPDLETRVNGSVNLMVNMNDEIYQLNDLTTTIQVTSSELPKSITLNIDGGIEADLRRNTIATKNLKLSGAGAELLANVTGKNIQTRPELQGKIQLLPFSPKKLATTLGHDLPNMPGLNQAQLDMNFFATANTVEISKLKAKIDDSTISGYLASNNLSRKNYRFDINVDQINLDNYMANSANQSSKKAQFQLISTANAAVKSNSKAQRSGLQELGRMNGTGKLDIAKLSAQNIKLQNFSANLRTGSGTIRLNPVQAQLYQGNLSADITVDARQSQPKFSIKETLNSVQIQPLLSDLGYSKELSGVANITSNITTSGEEASILLSNLNGTAAFQLKNGMLQGINIDQEIQRIEDAVRGKATPASGKQETVLGNASGSFTFKNGVAYNKDLLIDSQHFKVNGEGKANLVKQRLDYKATATHVKKGKPVGLAIPVKITGSFKSPNVSPDMSAIKNYLNSEQGNELLDKANKTIEEKLGTKIDLKQLFK